MKKLLIMLAVGAFALMLPSVASAEVKLPHGQILHVQRCSGTETVTGWTTAQGDSPLDTNAKAFVFTVTNGGCVVLFSHRSAELGVPVQGIRNLSFDFNESAYLGAGAPRISVVMSNGLVAYLSAYYCNNPLAASGNTWGRADFTGSTTTSSALCLFYDSTGTTYASTATMTAWQVFVAAHPDLSVAQSFFVADEPATTQTLPSGQYAIDRLSLGAKYMYDKSRTVGKFCGQNEAAC
jgi:hypothetical protein